MQAAHNTRSLAYRQPFGAVVIDTKVKLSLRIHPQGDNLQSVYLCYAYGLKEFSESRQRMKPVSDGKNFSFSGENEVVWFETYCDMPSEPGLFFYWFEIHVNGSRTWYTSDLEKLDGSGRFSPSKPHYHPGENLTPAPFQITVYLKRFSAPRWLVGASIYQIFPDRFFRGSDFNLKESIGRSNYPERLWHYDWKEDVDIAGRPETGYIACDFFGGTLAGIKEKLDYIAGLGIDVIYLNPIFKARSNHRYDTGDYEIIDPLLGSVRDFRELCVEAARLGIRIILDGVFSHTGADSKYFNKYDRYESRGAWQEAIEKESAGQVCSDYSSWYTFHRKGDEVYYDSWWGFPDLPSVNEHDLYYRHYMTGENGIVRSWLRMGASGWRLDVSDELPDSFLRDVRRAALAEKPDAMIMGEVWEDASRKISYGSYRDFLFGRTHDNIMGYPFRNAVINWLAGIHPAQRMHNELESIRENYPLVSFYSSMNLISSHDIPRAITAIAGLPDPGSRELQQKTNLSASARARGEKLLSLAIVLQAVYPGALSVYYGDETAMEGYRDPFNRRTFPWGSENKLLQRHFSEAINLRKRFPLLRTGFFTPLAAENDTYVFARSLNQDSTDIFGDKQSGPLKIIAVFNRSSGTRTVRLSDQKIDLPGYGYLLLDENYAVIFPNNRK